MKERLRRLITQFNRDHVGSSSLGRCELNLDETKEVLGVLAPDLQRLEDEFEVDVEKYWGISAHGELEHR